MTPRKAKKLLNLYFGPEAVNAFDPLWPETMLGVAPGAERGEVMDALRDRLTLLAAHPESSGDDALVFARVLRSVAAQMIGGPGTDWTPELETELDAPPLRLTLADESGHEERVVARLSHGAREGAVVAEAERAFRRQARALVATAGASPATIARLHALAEADGLSASVVDRFLEELVTPTERDEDDPAPPRSNLSSPAARQVFRDHVFSGDAGRGGGGSGVWIAAGAVVTLAVVAFSIFAIVAISNKQSAPPAPPQPAAPTQPLPAGPQTGTSSETVIQPAPAPSPPNVRDGRRSNAPPTADGPPDGRVFARSLGDALKQGVPAAQRERVILGGIDTLRKWWPRIDSASRVAAVQFIVTGAVDLSQTDASRDALIAALRQTPADPASPAAVWHATATAGLAAVLSRERELPPAVLEACKEVLTAGTGQAVMTHRSGSTFDEAATDALLLLPPMMLGKVDQPATVTRAQADNWLEALRAATGIGGSVDDAARRTDAAILDTVERLLTSEPDASSKRSIFDFVAAVLPQVRFREGDPGRDRVLAWFADTRLTASDVRLITAAVATRSAAAGIEPTMVLAIVATQADRDDLRAKYAEAWSKAGNAATKASGGANGDWYDAAKAVISTTNQATGDLEQLVAAANLARLNQAASLRSRGLPGQLPLSMTTPSTIPSVFFTTSKQGAGGGSDGEWARRFLGESRTAAARLARISEFEQMSGAGPIDCEVLAEAALLSTGETRAAAQRAALKRTDEPAMVNAVLEVLPKVKRSGNAGEFLGQFSLAGALPASSDRWGVHYRKALVERLLTLLAFANTTVAADRASVALAESWGTIAGTAAFEVQEIDGPTESVAAAARAYNALITQVRQQVAAPTALVHPDVLDKSRAGRLLVARGLPQAFAANQVSAVEALAVIIAAERPAAADQCRSLIAGLNADRAAARSVAVQIRVAEATALRLWAIRLGDPL